MFGSSKKILPAFLTLAVILEGTHAASDPDVTSLLRGVNGMGKSVKYQKLFAEGGDECPYFDGCEGCELDNVSCIEDDDCCSKRCVPGNLEDIVSNQKTCSHCIDGYETNHHDPPCATGEEGYYVTETDDRACCGKSICSRRGRIKEPEVHDGTYVFCGSPDSCSKKDELTRFSWECCSKVHDEHPHVMWELGDKFLFYKCTGGCSQYRAHSVQCECPYSDGCEECVLDYASCEKDDDCCSKNCGGDVDKTCSHCIEIDVDYSDNDIEYNNEIPCAIEEKASNGEYYVSETNDNMCCGDNMCSRPNSDGTRAFCASFCFEKDQPVHFDWECCSKETYQDMYARQNDIDLFRCTGGCSHDRAHICSSQEEVAVHDQKEHVTSTVSEV